MKYLTLIILITITNFVNAQVTVKNIENYGPEIIRAGEGVFAVTSDADGVLYFACDKGVLIYDGQSWEIVKVNNELGTRSVQYDSIRNRVWVGGLGTFGYLQAKGYHQYQYMDISSNVFAKNSFKKVWQIFCEPEHVTFITYEGHFIATDSAIIRKDINDHLLFKLDGYQYLSKRGDGLSTIQRKGDLPTIKNAPGNIFRVLALDHDQHLIITYREGAFIHQLSTGRVFPYQAPLNELIKKYPVYDAFLLNENLLVIATWAHGVLITDVKGNLIDHITKNTGLISDYILDVELDYFGKLWIATDYGVSVVNLKKAWPSLSLPPRPLPKTIIKYLEIDHDSIIYIHKPNELLSITKRPNDIRVHFTTPGNLFTKTQQVQTYLEGYDTAWRVSPNQDHAEYLELPNGDYRFRVKSIIDSVETQEYDIRFIIHEPWYSNAFEVGGSIIVAVLISVIIALIITYRLEASRKRLARLVAEKTHEIETREHELEKMNKALVEINSELDTFLYRSSHDLISPVKSVQGLISLLKISKENENLDIEADYLIGLMDSSIKRLENILLEISAYVKTSKREPIKSQFLLKDLINEVWAEVEFMEGASVIDFKLKVDEALQIESDRNRWKMVISNLVTNAIKYSDQKKEYQFIAISVKEEHDLINLAVEDNGQGIEKQYHCRLFEMFFRASDTSNGTGLGLFLVKKVVESLKGTITLESEFQVSTKVQIVIPTVYNA